MPTMTEAVREDDLKAGDRIRLEGIDWDTDGDDPADLELPTETEITVPDDWEQGETIADVLSDRYGFCIHGISTIRRL